LVRSYSRRKPSGFVQRGGGLWATLAGASITIGRAPVSFGTALVDGFDERRKENYEVAYVYEIQKRLGTD
jgi:hypothetical protein